jgi:hypothetical protein
MEIFKKPCSFTKEDKFVIALPQTPMDSPSFFPSSAGSRRRTVFSCAEQGLRKSRHFCLFFEASLQVRTLRGCCGCPICNSFFSGASRDTETQTESIIRTGIGRSHQGVGGQCCRRVTTTTGQRNSPPVLSRDVRSPLCFGRKRRLTFLGVYSNELFY